MNWCIAVVALLAGLTFGCIITTVFENKHYQKCTVLYLLEDEEEKP